MNAKDIRDIPSIKKMVDEANQIKVIKKYWPLIKPILKLFNSDLDSLEENLKKLPEMYEELNRITSLPDKFNDIFSNMVGF